MHENQKPFKGSLIIPGFYDIQTVSYKHKLLNMGDYKNIYFSEIDVSF